MTDKMVGVDVRAERLHVMVSRACNNDCVFCLEDPFVRRRARFGDPIEILERFFRRDAVLFTCGEPTLHRHLLSMVAKARALGYREIGLVTNGRLLGRDDLARRLVDAGLTEVTVSIHSHRPEVHNRLVGRRAFLQTLYGLDLVASLGADRVTLKSSTVVTKLNVGDLDQTLLFLSRRGVQVVNLNYVEPAGKAAEAFRRLAPRMSEVAAVLALVPKDCCRELVVTGVPACVLGHGPRAGRREVIWHWKDGAFVQLTANRGQVHGPPCETCDARAHCDGVWSKYAHVFGWGEFHPIARGWDDGHREH